MARRRVGGLTFGAIACFALTLILCLYQWWSRSWFRGRSIDWASPTTPDYLRHRGLAPLSLSLSQSWEEADGLPLDREYFLGKRVVICGLLRDKEAQVPYLQRSLGRISAHFQDWALVVVEDGSADRTRDWLLQWQRTSSHPIFVLDHDSANHTHPSCAGRMRQHDYSECRIQRMVALRNEYLTFIQGHATLSAFDFVVVMDLDLKGFVYQDGLWNSAFHFRSRPDIQALAANGLQMTNVLPIPGLLHTLSYQDPFAHEDAANEGKGDPQHWDNFRSNLVNRFYYGQPLHAVRSAFSGFTIYRAAALRHHYYRVEYGGEQRQHVLCEHVGLHRQLQHVFLNPSMMHVIVDNSDGNGGEGGIQRENLDVFSQIV